MSILLELQEIALSQHSVLVSDAYKSQVLLKKGGVDALQRAIECEGNGYTDEKAGKLNYACEVLVVDY